MHGLNGLKMYFCIRMVTYNNEKLQYGIGTNETLRYFNGTANGTLLHN